jgi:putative ABC transport system permease protein
VVENTLQTRRFDVVLLGAFAAMALLMAAVGLYGVVSHLTARRSREFGIRLALGAARRDVLGMVLKEGCLRAAIGVCAGLAISAAASRLLRSMLFGVGSLDFMSYLLSAGTLFVVAVAAAWLPARRAVRLDPARTLRSE